MIFFTVFQAVLDSLLLASVTQLSTRIRQSVDRTTCKIRQALFDYAKQKISSRAVVVIYIFNAHSKEGLHDTNIVCLCSDSCQCFLLEIAGDTV